MNKYQEIITKVNNSEKRKELSNDVKNKKFAEIGPNIASKDVKELISLIMECDLGYPDYYPSNESFWNEKDNSCLNLVMDLADQEAKVWRNKNHIDVINSEGVRCIANGGTKLRKLMNDLKEDEKKLVGLLEDELYKFQLVYNDHLTVLQDEAEKLVVVNKQIKKIYGNNCKCKK